MEGKKSLNKEKLWTKNFILMMIISLLISGTIFLQMATLPLYIVEIGGNDSIIGLATGVFTIAALLFRPIFGHLLDKKGRKIVLITGICILCIIFVLYNLADTVIVFLLLRIFNGIGFSAFSTASGTVISDIVPKAKLSEGIGYFGIANTLSAAVGPALGLYIVEVANFTVLFWITVLLGVISLIITMLMKYESPVKNSLTILDCNIKEGDINFKNLGKIQLRNLIEKTTIPPAIVMIFIASALSVVLNFIPVFGEARNIDNIGMFYTVYASSLIFIRFLAGKMTNRFGTNRLIILGLVLLFVSQIFLAFTDMLSISLGAGILFGMGFGITQPILNTLVIKLCHPQRRGVANATFFSSLDIGVGVGAMLFGIILQISNFTYVFLGSSVTIILAGVAYYLMLRDKVEEDYSVIDVKKMAS